MRDYKFWPVLGTYGHWAGRVLKSSNPTVTRANLLWWSSPKTCFIDTCCRAFGSETVPWFNDLGLSRPEIEPWFTACEVNALPLRHRCGYKSFMIVISTSKLTCNLFGQSSFDYGSLSRSSCLYNFLLMSLFTVNCTRTFFLNCGNKKRLHIWNERWVTIQKECLLWT